MSESINLNELEAVGGERPQVISRTVVVEETVPHPTELDTYNDRDNDVYGYN